MRLLTVMKRTMLLRSSCRTQPKHVPDAPELHWHLLGMEECQLPRDRRRTDRRRYLCIALMNHTRVIRAAE